MILFILQLRLLDRVIKVLEDNELKKYIINIQKKKLSWDIDC